MTVTTTREMKEGVHKAIQEIGAYFPAHEIQVLEDETGGAYVLVQELDLGECFAPARSWVGFHITDLYPEADVYPHFVSGDVRYVGGAIAPNGGFPESINPNNTMPGFDLPALMVSRRSNRWNPKRDTAALKLVRVLDWIRSRP